MKVPWSGSRCILCLQEKELTNEHILPAFLGGKLQSEMLCPECNSHLGTTVDVTAKNDPAIKLAVQNVAGSIPEFARTFYEGQEFKVKGPGPKAKATWKKGRLKTNATKLADGSLIQHTPEARNSLKRILRNDGLTDEDIDSAIIRFDEAEENQAVQLSPGCKVIKWSVESVRPSLSGRCVGDLFPLKMAYEFLALHIGDQVYYPEFQPIRDALIKEQNSDSFHVRQGHVRPYLGWHGLSLIEAEPCVVMIRLFSAVRFKVEFPLFAWDGSRSSYRQNLTTGEESCICMEDNKVVES